MKFPNLTNVVSSDDLREPLCGALLTKKWIVATNGRLLLWIDTKAFITEPESIDRDYWIPREDLKRLAAVRKYDFTETADGKLRLKSYDGGALLAEATLKTACVGRQPDVDAEIQYVNWQGVIPEEKAWVEAEGLKCIGLDLNIVANLTAALKSVGLSGLDLAINMYLTGASKAIRVAPRVDCAVNFGAVIMPFLLGGADAYPTLDSPTGPDDLL